MHRVKNSLKHEIHCDKPAQESKYHRCYRHFKAMVILTFPISAGSLGGAAQVCLVKSHEVMTILSAGGMSLLRRYL